jgi:shikimate dehydrogenase
MDASSGENTDGEGFVASLRTCLDPRGRDVVIFGAGGAARAIAVQTALAGAASITIVNRNAGRAAFLAAHVAEHTPAAARAQAWTPNHPIPAACDVLVNATSIGLYPDTHARLDIDTDTLCPGLVVADVIPNPPVTALLRDATERGCTTLTGQGMLVNQGRANILHWTGLDVDPAVLHAELSTIFPNS